MNNDRGILTMDPQGPSKLRDVTWIRAFALDTARNRQEIFPGIPGGWDFIGILDTNNSADEVTIHFPEQNSDGVRLIKGRAIRLIKGVTLEKFFLTNTAQSGGSVTLFVGGEGGAEFAGSTSVEIVGNVTVDLTNTATAADGQVSVGITATQIRPANGNRTLLAIRNIGANRIWIGIDNGITANNGLYIDPAEQINFDRMGGYTGAIWGIAVTAATLVGFIEVG